LHHPEILSLKVATFKGGRSEQPRSFLGRPHRGMECRRRLWISITGRKIGRRLKDSAVVVGLHEFSPISRWATLGIVQRSPCRNSHMVTVGSWSAGPGRRGIRRRTAPAGVRVPFPFPTLRADRLRP